MLKISKEDAIQILSDRLQELDQRGFDSESWKNRTILDLKQIFITSDQWLQISSISFNTYITEQKVAKFAAAKNTAKKSIISYIDFIEQHSIIREQKKKDVEETYKQKYNLLLGEWNTAIPKYNTLMNESVEWIEVEKSLWGKIEELEIQLKDKEIKEDFIPIEILLNTRGYLTNTANQAILCYQNGIFDGCLILTRKLIEGLIIECYETHGMSSNIINKDGNFLYLSDLITETLKESSWNLSRNFKQACPNIKKYGDMAAHNRRFNAKKLDVDNIKGEIRVVIEELVHLAKFKTKDV